MSVCHGPVVHLQTAGPPPAGLEVDQQQKISLLLTGSSCTSCLVGDSRSCSSLNLQSAEPAQPSQCHIENPESSSGFCSGPPPSLLCWICVNGKQTFLILQVFGLRDERRRGGEPPRQEQAVCGGSQNHSDQFTSLLCWTWPEGPNQSSSNRTLSVPSSVL